MPHTKCVACKIRLHSSRAPAEMVGDLCPGCGGRLEPVKNLAEVVGYRRSSRRAEVADVELAQAAALPRPGTRPVTGTHA